jgi:hypothetical protein
VPDQHIVPSHRLSPEAQGDVRGYLEQLAANSSFFERTLKARAGDGSRHKSTR